MEYEKQLLWIIPPNGYEDRNLEDGQGVFYKKKIEGSHFDDCQDFSKKYNMGGENLTSHMEYAKYFNKLGFIICFNSGITIDSKYYISLCLPEQMTKKQIEFLEDRKELFEEKYHEDISFFEAQVYTSSNDIGYRSSVSGYRDLQIESIINGNKINNGQTLLYNEISRQYENLESKNKSK